MDAKQTHLAAAKAVVDEARSNQEQAQLDYGSQVSGIHLDEQLFQEQ